MPHMTAQDLAEHLRLLKIATPDDLDDLLQDLLTRCYPTKTTQDC